MKPQNLIQLRPHEQVLQTVREDFIPAMPWWFFLFVWVAVPFFFLFPLISQGTLGIIFLTIMVSTGILMLARSRYAWQRTALIVTDERVVDISQHGFFDREIAEVNHSDIDEVTYRVKGIFSTAFRYGTVYIRTAGERADIGFRRAHRPIDLSHLLNDLRKDAGGDSVVLDRVKKLKSLAGRLSDVEVDRLAAVVANREKQVAAKDFFQS